MRRYASTLAALSAVVLCSCAGGGSVLNSGGATPDRVILTVQGSSNVPRVLPGAGLPISAVGVRGSGNGVSSDNRFIWSAAVSSGASYVADSLGVLKPCASLAITTAAVTTTYTPDYSIFVTIDPSNEANIIFSPPPIVPVAAGSTVTLAYPYCVTVSATAVQGGAVGSLTVAVVNPQNPLQ